MPLSLTRNLLVIFIPGGIAIAPIALLLVSKFTYVQATYDEYQSLFHVVYAAISIIIGTVIEGFSSHLEVKWDEERESEYSVEENWYQYLSNCFASEPVAHKYIARMVTLMYYELGMAIAVPIFFSGIAILVWDLSLTYANFVGAIAVILTVCAPFYFIRQAKLSHKALCKIRLQLNQRVANANKSLLPSVDAPTE